MTPTQRQAALEALNTLINHYKIGAKYDAEINKIRAALQSTPEPASVREFSDYYWKCCDHKFEQSESERMYCKLYDHLRQSTVKENEG